MKLAERPSRDRRAGAGARPGRRSQHGSDADPSLGLTVRDLDRQTVDTARAARDVTRAC